MSKMSRILEVVEEDGHWEVYERTTRWVAMSKVSEEDAVKAAARYIKSLTPTENES